MPTRVLLVDDEPLGRERIRNLLEADPEIEIVGECESGPEAVEAVERLRPDLMFLDVQMPGLGGFEVLEALGPERMPATVFVTAYDRYALQAFEVHAVDYLLKPFDEERFRTALKRAREHIGRSREGQARQSLLALLGQVTAQADQRPLQRIVIKSVDGIFFLRCDEIDWIEAAGNFVRIHAGTHSHLLRETMSAMEAKLDPDQFLRIHRSTIVHIESIKELQPLFHGDYAVILRDGTQLTLSRSYRPKLQKFFGNAL